jgi:hypothetical protein
MIEELIIDVTDIAARDGLPLMSLCRAPWAAKQFQGAEVSKKFENCATSPGSCQRPVAKHVHVDEYEKPHLRSQSLAATRGTSAGES